MSGLQLNFGPLKEPLGFIKVLEWVSMPCGGDGAGGGAHVYIGGEAARMYI